MLLIIRITLLPTLILNAGFWALFKFQPSRPTVEQLDQTGQVVKSHNINTATALGVALGILIFYLSDILVSWVRDKVRKATVSEQPKQ